MDLVRACPLLHAPFRVSWWCANAYAQFAVFLAKCALYAHIYASLFEHEVLVLPDGQAVRLLWLHHAAPRGVVLLLHGILGASTDFAPLARVLHTAGFAVVGFDRRGHGLPLTVPRFNTTGSVADLEVVLQHVRSRLAAPIYAVGVSAGSSVLARYLGETRERSLVAAAVCISPGFAFERSLSTISGVPEKAVLTRMKAFFLHAHAAVLRSAPQHERMMAARTVLDWHEHQYAFAGYTDRAAYFLKEDPVHVLRDVQVPVLYLNASDVRLWCLAPLCAWSHACVAGHGLPWAAADFPIRFFV